MYQLQATTPEGKPLCTWSDLTMEQVEMAKSLTYAACKQNGKSCDYKWVVRKGAK